MKIDRRALFLLPSMGAVLAGCPDNTTGDDAFVTPMADAFVATEDAFMPPGTDGGRDAFVAPDAFVEPGTDAGTDAFVEADAFGDAGPPPLPAIVNPMPHTVPASATGHDRFFAVTFAPDSSFYVTGVRAAGTDAATNDYETIVAHFGADGELDTTFGTDGWFVRNLAVGLAGEIARGITLQSDGKIVVAATVEHVATGADPRDRDIALFRLNTDGTLDDTFGTDGVELIDLTDGEALPAPSTAYVADSAWNVRADAMDRLVVAVGPKRTGGTDTDFGVLRLLPDGERDTTFGTGGLYQRDIANVNASVRSLELLPEGRISLAGYYSDGGSIRPVILVLDSTGAPVTGFGTMGLYTEVVLTTQVEAYDAVLQGERFVTAGYGREEAMGDNDFISLRVDATTGVRDLTYGTGGYALLGGYDFSDNARGLVVLPDQRILMIGSLRTATSEADGALVLMTRDGVFDTTFGDDGVQLIDTSAGTLDHLWGVDVDPRGERVVVVGIGGTDPATNDNGLVYLFPVP